MEKKAYIGSTVVLGGTLYRAEVDHLTKNNLHKIRQVLGAAMWGNKGPRNQIAGLLLHKQGQVEAFVKRATQLAGHWQRMVRKGHLEGIEFQLYWDKIKRHTSTTKGPIHLFAKLMNDIGIESDATHKWNMDGK